MTSERQERAARWRAFWYGVGSVFDFGLLTGLAVEEFDEEPPALEQALAEIRKSSERIAGRLEQHDHP